jgi:leucyl aminopeptidase (aminopeptidase T)
MSYVCLHVRTHTRIHARAHKTLEKCTTAAEKKVQDLEGELARTKKAAEEEAKKKAEVEVAAAKQMADQEAAARKRAEEERKRAEEAAAAVAAAAEKKAAEEVCVLVCTCVKSKPNHDQNTSKVNQNTTSACTFTLRKSLARLETCERDVQVQLCI